MVALLSACGGSSNQDSTTNNNRQQESNTIIDKTAPIITILGDNPLEITQGETFSDPGATATDNIDGEVAVTPNGTVDMSTIAEYTITYTAKDKVGNKATATRVVRVKSADVVWNVSTVTELRQALENASANGENDKILLSAGTYKTTSDGLGTFKFNDNEEFNLTIESVEGLSRDDVVLSGDHSMQVFNFNNTKNSTLIFRGVSIIDGNSSTNGGGIYSNQNIEVENCDITNNNSDNKGGGFYANVAIVTNSTISDNNSYLGGGFYTGTTTVSNSTISNNTSSRNGGGFYSGITTVTNLTISNNSTSDGKGGGFYSGTTTVIDSTISNNSSRYSGGGFYSGTTTISNSIVSHNISHHHGGGFHAETTTVSNSTISNNTSRYSGGGFYSEVAKVTNSIFSENNATIGASFYSYHYFNYSSYISNNIFIKNKGSLYSKGVFINNIFDNNGDTDMNLRGDSKIYNNYIDYNKIEENGNNVIKKQNLQPSSEGDVYLNNDNETLASNSPVIDKGLNISSATYKKIIDNDDVYNQMVELLITDKVGNKRVYNGTIDIGAVEYGSSK